MKKRTKKTIQAIGCCVAMNAFAILTSREITTKGVCLMTIATLTVLAVFFRMDSEDL